ncbi:MAG: hypothetical protein AAF366_18485 [Pseudomonadota bacterium]
MTEGPKRKKHFSGSKLDDATQFMLGGLAGGAPTFLFLWLASKWFALEYAWLALVLLLAYGFGFVAEVFKLLSLPFLAAGRRAHREDDHREDDETIWGRYSTFWWGSMLSGFGVTAWWLLAPGLAVP